MPLRHGTVEEAVEILGRINANANNMDLPNGTSVGCGLYTFSSMGNHSDQCGPERFALCWWVLLLLLCSVGISVLHRVHQLNVQRV